MGLKYTFVATDSTVDRRQHGKKTVTNHLVTGFVLSHRLGSCQVPP